jgi:hypothetical protein
MTTILSSRKNIFGPSNCIKLKISSNVKPMTITDFTCFYTNSRFDDVALLVVTTCGLVGKYLRFAETLPPRSGQPWKWRQYVCPKRWSIFPGESLVSAPFRTFYSIHDHFPISFYNMLHFQLETTNTMTVIPEGSTPPISKPAIGQDTISAHFLSSQDES